MWSTLFHIDRAVDLDRLTAAVADVIGVPRRKVAGIALEDFRANPRAWFTDAMVVGIQTGMMRGDFPLEVTVTARTDQDTEPFVRSLALALGVTILTDEFGVESWTDDQWMMLTPDGEATKVLTNDDDFGAEDPAINLLPEYRALYEARNVAGAARS
jgi:hypothetical protein